MRILRLEIVRFFAALTIVLMAECGKETVNIPDMPRPRCHPPRPLKVRPR